MAEHFAKIVSDVDDVEKVTRVPSSRVFEAEDRGPALKVMYGASMSPSADHNSFPGWVGAQRDIDGSDRVGSKQSRRSAVESGQRVGFVVSEYSQTDCVVVKTMSVIEQGESEVTIG